MKSMNEKKDQSGYLTKEEAIREVKEVMGEFLELQAT